MPIIKQNFSLNYEESKKLEETMKKVSYDIPTIVNECLERKVAPKLIEKATFYLPKSAKGKRHAKENIWYETYFYNLSFVVSNKVKGKKSTNFYYLYYPATGTGQSYKKGPNNFLGKGEKRIHSEAVLDLLNSLNKNIEEEFINEK